MWRGSGRGAGPAARAWLRPGQTGSSWSSPASVKARQTAGEATTSRNPVPFAAACWWARTSRLMPDESQNRVAVMPAMTVLTPGAMADPRCWPARPALANVDLGRQRNNHRGHLWRTGHQGHPLRQGGSQPPGFPGGHGFTGPG